MSKLDRVIETLLESEKIFQEMFLMRIAFFFNRPFSYHDHCLYK
ncbi:hypothetical protein BGP_4940 [Beggiatoa sp. PS]|nr:hypothetical protein BGP_4940 [Beggiatoa sp. PS]